MNRYMGVPKAHRDLVAETIVEDLCIQDPDTGDLEHGGGGAYCPSECVILLDRDTGTPAVARHELGHLVYHEVLSPGERDRVMLTWRGDMFVADGWDGSAPRAYFTRRAMRNHEEAFAEAYALLTSPFRAVRQFAAGGWGVVLLVEGVIREAGR